MIEIQSGDAGTDGQGVRPRNLNDELPFAGVFENRGTPFKTARDNQVYGTVVVVICSDSPTSGALLSAYGLVGLIGKSSVAVVAPQPVN